MKRRNPVEKLAKKRQNWLERTAQALSITEDEARELLSIPRRQSLRFNTLKSTGPDSKPSALTALQAEGWRGQLYAWMPEGYTIESDHKLLRDSDLVKKGTIYIQNAASWLPVLALDPQAGEEILDVCAAPGGKTSHIAALTGNKAIIVANDNSRARLAKLKANLNRLDVTIAEYTLYDATQLARRFAGRQFDRILIDAPCSGEGLMNYTNDRDFSTWSVAHIKRLQQLQKRIITQSWQLLKSGGTMIYSTCTMAPEENEAVIAYLLHQYPEARVMPIQIPLPNRTATVQEWNGKHFNPAISDAIRLKPSTQIEAFFVCQLKKQ